ncbi:MAG TPA: hypothetical protein VGQ42_03140 [Candidatus Dormibacteraeota bacterium]|jgi:hypothetical protein|nr:hypothetical protein [Candidatus Dormibacteraeota bacterium]
MPPAGWTSEGRVIAAYTDGCQPDLGPPAKHGTCLADATRLSGLNPEIQGPAMARQSCGLTLYAKYDPQAVPCTAAAAAAPTGTTPVTGGPSAQSGAAPPSIGIPNTSAPRGAPAAALLSAIGVAALVVAGGRRRRRRQ